MQVQQYCLNWNCFTSNLCNGFAGLQKNEEFVDMTLAADGHLVKVHKSIFALASPYIKMMLQSTASEHPVIFLGNVSHEVLSYILTYVYTGEVAVEVDKMQSFMRVAKELRLCGLFGLPSSKVHTKEKNDSSHINITEPRIHDGTISSCGNTLVKSGCVHIDPLVSSKETVTEELDVDEQHTLSSNLDLCMVPSTATDKEADSDRESELFFTADGYQYNLQLQQMDEEHQNNASNRLQNTLHNPQSIQASYCASTDDADISLNIADLSSVQHTKNGCENEILTSLLSSAGALNPKDFTPLYTFSNRGSLQLILNRYMYYCHHHSQGGRKRRWRCIDYRSNHCPAFIDTDCDKLTVRKFGHKHSFHDEKIRKKMVKDSVFTNIHLLQKKIKGNKKDKS